MTSALRWYFAQTVGPANEIALNYLNDLMALHKAMATIARRLSVVKALAKYARMTGPREVALLRLAFDLALRIGELARLDVVDVESSIHQR